MPFFFLIVPEPSFWQRDYSVAKALFKILQKNIETSWIEEKLADSIVKFNSDVIDHLRETDFERNSRDYSWQTKSRSRSRESLSRERSSLTKLVQSFENSLKREKQLIRQRFPFFHSQNSQKSSSIEHRNVQSADRWISSEKFLLLKKSRRSSSLNLHRDSSRSILESSIVSSSPSSSSFPHQTYSSLPPRLLTLIQEEKQSVE